MEKRTPNVGRIGEKWYLCGDLKEWSPPKMNHLIFYNEKELLRLRCDRIIYVASDGHYYSIFIADGYEQVVAIQLGQIETLMGEQLGDEGRNFIRIGRSLIINKDFIYYINPNKQELILCDNAMQKHKLSASKDALHAIKEYLERELKSTHTKVDENI